LLFAYVFSVFFYFATKKNYRKSEEHGSAKWGNARTISKKYEEKTFSENKILTQNFRMGLDGKKHKRNLNTLVVGGSGAGKTRFFCLPNILQKNSSFVITDPKGEILRDTRETLEDSGYEVKVLDLINMEKSNCYNPFCYLKTDNDVQKFVTNLFRATAPKDAKKTDSFWDTSASMLLMSLIFLVKSEFPPKAQRLGVVADLLRRAKTLDNGTSELDNIFSALSEKNPEHIALKYFENYQSGAKETLQSIQITLASRLEKFNLESLANLTSYDELNFRQLGEKKTAIFIVIPDNDSSFNFLVSVLYTQIFQELFYIADYEYSGSLPIHVQFLMDEFSNVALPDDFEKILSVIRSRNMSISIVLQNLAQLKALFPKAHESIVGNCDTFLYLGGNEFSTFEYVSKLLGKETIDVNSYGKSGGRNGNFSTNFNISGRELLTPDEIRKLDNKYAILFVRGERPIIDRKYDVTHKNTSKN